MFLCFCVIAAVGRVGICVQTAPMEAMVTALTCRLPSSHRLGRRARWSSGTTWAASPLDRCKSVKEINKWIYDYKENSSLCRSCQQKPVVLFSHNLQVLLKHGNASHEVWSQSGNQGNKWRRGEVFLGLLNNFQVSQCCRTTRKLELLEKCGEMSQFYLFVFWSRSPMPFYWSFSRPCLQSFFLLLK